MRVRNDVRFVGVRRQRLSGRAGDGGWRHGAEGAHRGGGVARRGGAGEDGGRAAHIKSDLRLRLEILWPRERERMRNGERKLKKTLSYMIIQIFKQTRAESFAI